MKKTLVTFTSSVIIILLSFTISCKKKDKNEPENTGFSNKIYAIISQPLLDSLRNRGMTIHEGIKPPSVEGIYHVSPNQLISNFGPEDPFLPGAIFNDYKYRFYNQTSDEVKTDFHSLNGSDAGTGQGSFLSGYGDNFTLFTQNTGVSNGVAYKTVAVTSGSITAAGIKDYQYAFILTEKNGDHSNTIMMPVTTSRIFNDKDGLAERAAQFKLSADTTKSGRKSIMEK